MLSLYGGGALDLAGEADGWRGRTTRERGRSTRAPTTEAVHGAGGSTAAQYTPAHGGGCGGRAGDGSAMQTRGHPSAKVLWTARAGGCGLLLITGRFIQEIDFFTE